MRDSFRDNVLVRSKRTSAAKLQEAKLRLELREQRFWWLKVLAPYVAALVAVAGILGTYIHEKNAERSQRAADGARLLQGQRNEDEQQQRFIAQLRQNETDALLSRSQNERHHQEELFTQAVTQLGSRDPMQQVAAIHAVSTFAERPEFQTTGMAALATLLNQENDPAIEEAVYGAFDQAGRVARDALVQANLRAQDVLARAYGNYVGLEFAKAYPGQVETMLYAAKERETKEFERQIIIGDPVAASYYSRSPIEELRPHDFIRNAYWLQNFPETQMEAFQTAKNGSWKYPPNDVNKAIRKALDVLAEATNHLELTSAILEKLVTEHSGRVSGWNLTGVYFVVPDFRHKDLRGLILQSSHLRMADLRNANLTSSNCANADFNGANLAFSSFRKTNLEGADLGLTEPFPVDRGPNRTYTFTAPGTPESLRFEAADFRGSSWVKAKEISGPLRRYLEATAR